MCSCVRNRLWILLICVIISSVSSNATLKLWDKIDDSKVYPGSVHEFLVTIPDSYKGDSPAALYVGLDAPLYNAPDVIDSLIAEGSIPVMIGVYFQPGVILGADSTVTRYNRSNEYDAIDGRLARFIETELLPAAESLVTPDGRRVMITDNPDLRMISGASSGGIGAFVAAWSRPDLFRRVYTTCGTFVSMRGGDLLPALVRKTEPKPLRIFIHDGSNDAWNPLFGHWYEQNQLMASSLKFAGYDVDCRWDDGAHSITNGAALFPEAMRWLWRDYPAAITPGDSGNSTLSALLVAGEGWTRSESSTPHPAPLSTVSPDGKIFVEPENDSSCWLLASTIAPDGSKTASQKAYLLHDITFSNPGLAGIAFDTDGNLYAATAMGIQIADQNGRVRAIIPWPTEGTPQAFSFIGNTLRVTIGGDTYSRVIAATAAPIGQRIAVKSQGQA